MVTPFWLAALGAAQASAAHFWCHKTSDGQCETPIEDNFSCEEMRAFVRVVTSMQYALVSDTVDASTIQNKVLAGYQGWDGARSTWDHWSNDGKVPNPSSGNEHFEMVPEMGEYPEGALHSTEFKYKGNGSFVPLYENAKDGVVNLHFKWMQEYGVDGVMIQRFISECINPGPALTQRNLILEQVDVAAAKYGRVYAMMWDMSGASRQWDTEIKKDWSTYVKNYTSSKQYLKENGKPVVCIFGIGLQDRSQATPSSSLGLVRWLQKQGLYVIGSGPFYWRTGEHDAAKGFDEVHAAFDAIMPWAVGRYNTVSDFKARHPTIMEDARLTSSRNQGYAPIAYAGYSYRDTSKINFIRRNAGQFFKAQIDSHLKTKGATFYYIAMFDEVQEGTAIYKFAANDTESADGSEFVTASIDGVDCPGDFYLTMAGQYAVAAKGGPPVPPAPGPAPSPPSAKDTLALGDHLPSGTHLISSAGIARLEMQASDGNLVLYGRDEPLWSSKTSGHPGAELRFQKSDGNLVLYDDSTALWSSGAHDRAVTVQLHDNCDLLTSDANGTVLWSLGTACERMVVTV